MRLSAAIPINPAVLAGAESIRDAFQRNTPLTDFVIVTDFLDQRLLEQALIGCDQARLATFCGHAPLDDPDDLRNEFFEPVEGRLYVTIHHRPVEPVPMLQALHDLFVMEETIAAMEQLTGVVLSRKDHRSVLTAWGPWSFLRPHTDASDRTRANGLIVSLSLTRNWDTRYGGMTGFQWNAAGPTTWVAPQLNTAVLFRPFAGSVHWVEQISGDAPDRLRYTFTMQYA